MKAVAVGNGRADRCSVGLAVDAVGAVVVGRLSAFRLWRLYHQATTIMQTKPPAVMEKLDGSGATTAKVRGAKADMDVLRAVGTEK
jgi:hypothetical protein